MKIYNCLLIIRTQYSVSRLELANRVDVNVQTIGFIERGDYYPSLELAMRIALVFDKNINDIFSTKKFTKTLPNNSKETQ